MALSNNRANGLSPLARGTHQSSELKRRINRFIPAGAGNSLRGHIEQVRETVYPRWRGELGHG